MKKAVFFLKQIGTVVAAVLKAKTLAVKNKTRLMIFGLLRNKKVLMSAISNKIHALKGQEKGGEAGRAAKDGSKAMVMYSAAKKEVPPSSPGAGHVESSLDNVEEEDYPDLTHGLFDLDDEEEDDELNDNSCSVIDLVRSSREDGSEFNLEDEIDHIADVFIWRFRRQMRLQKQDSLKSFQEMLEGSG